MHSGVKGALLSLVINDEMSAEKPCLCSRANFFQRK